MILVSGSVVLTCRFFHMGHTRSAIVSTNVCRHHGGASISLVLSARAPVSTQLPCGKRFHSELCTHLFKKEVSIGQDQARGPTKGASHGASHLSNYLKFNQEKAVLCKTAHKT